MTSGPTTGANDSADRQWDASPATAIAIRVLVTVAPFAMAWIAVAGFSERFLRPAGKIGVAIWLLQALITGVAVSMTTELFARRLMPLASLFNMTLVFPDQAPSRFGVALRAGSVKRLRNRYDTAIGDRANDEGAGPGQSADSAAAAALELIGLLSSHDRLTRGHTERVRAHAVLIAEEMGVSTADRELLTWGAMLHDIGKLTVSPDILNKPGKPTDAEWAQLQGHPAASAQMLLPLESWLGEWVLAAPQHHERWDGTGYPLGLSGTDISLAGRITAVADAYDVITSRRSYKKPMPVEAARKELIRCAGTQFDPDVVRAFLNVSLQRRWAAGPLASLTELPKILNLGANLQSTAVIVVGATVAVGSVASIPPPVPDELASTTPQVVQTFETTVIDEGNNEPVATAPLRSAPPASSGRGEAENTSTSLTIVDTESTLAGGAATSTTAPTIPDPADSELQPGPPTSATATTIAPTVSTTLWSGLSSTTSSTATSPATTTTWWATSSSSSKTSAPTTTSTAPTTTTPSTPTSTTTSATSATTSTSTTTTTTTTTVPTTTTTSTTTSTTDPGSPLAINDFETIEENKDLKIHVLDNDDEGNSAFDEATLEILSPPSNAKDYRVHNDHLHYKSEKDFEGTETIVYQICNASGLCDTGLVTITVTA